MTDRFTYTYRQYSVNAVSPKKNRSTVYGVFAHFLRKRSGTLQQMSLSYTRDKM